jgi:hypothetical protein
MILVSINIMMLLLELVNKLLLMIMPGDYTEAWNKTIKFIIKLFLIWSRLNLD